jgi:hypothetical protein
MRVTRCTAAFRAKARRCFEVSSSPVVRQYNTILMLGDLYADELVTHIAHDRRNISLERVSVTTAAGGVNGQPQRPQLQQGVRVGRIYRAAGIGEGERSGFPVSTAFDSKPGRA